MRYHHAVIATDCENRNRNWLAEKNKRRNASL